MSFFIIQTTFSFLGQQVSKEEDGHHHLQGIPLKTGAELTDHHKLCTADLKKKEKKKRSLYLETTADLSL